MISPLSSERLTQNHIPRERTWYIKVNKGFSSRTKNWLQIKHWSHRAFLLKNQIHWNQNFKKQGNEHQIFSATPKHTQLSADPCPRALQIWKMVLSHCVFCEISISRQDLLWNTLSTTDKEHLVYYKQKNQLKAIYVLS